MLTYGARDLQQRLAITGSDVADRGLTELGHGRQPKQTHVTSLLDAVAHGGGVCLGTAMLERRMASQNALSERNAWLL